MTSSATSTEGGRNWSSYVLGKIRSLWSAGPSSVGLNQLVSGTGLISYKNTFSVLHGSFCICLACFTVLSTDI